MYLRQRNGIWYFRRRVPTDLVGVIEPGKFHFSLHTNNRQAAVRAYADALRRSEYEIEQARAKLRADAETGRVEVHPTRRKSQRIKWPLYYVGRTDCPI